ncbi:hypothetical protein COU13_01975 [Candidatus Kaiserbacteria bacterium CG10_big_fil_rev_8_21_14_0_10_43_70]|uniref:PKD domain-containing protein n=1 Tax=Candidatus Kaiserbacteria bacterium CG10_big_fil_rev_8_21_14_0_10_43_70 TaxID=1974605 RepID=A0A2H0UIN4_9BACT|nr:MAG: hypothetical protein COU13_01975 [Candidatus Kaiserbacteria bacterium CG10_big_fil_rev_8_21_14_0_10_43_70]
MNSIFKKSSVSLALMIVFVLLLLPLSIHAATIDEIRLQIAALFERIQTLQAELDSIGSGGSAGGTAQSPSSVGSGACPDITRGLSIGSEGADVTALQKYLASDPSIYPEAIISGYFGTLTQAAVGRWQASRGIVSSGTPDTTGYGSVGPRTREALRNCGGGGGGGNVDPGEVGALLRVTPITGNSPLTVSATASINTARSCSFAIYRIDFGDGTPPTDLTVPSGVCQEITRTITHTYINPGNYIVTLSIGTHKTTVRVAVDPGIFTGNPTDPGIVSVSPNAGAVPLAVNASFLLRTGNPYEIDWGDGTPPSVSGSFHARQSLPFGTTVFTQLLETKNLSHTYRVGGTHTIILRTSQYEKQGDLWVWQTRFYTAQVTATGTAGPGSGAGGEGFTVSPTSGDAPLSVKFTVRVNGSGSCSGGSYTLDFGDGEKTGLPYPADGCAPQDYEVTHIYETVGTFTASLYPTTPSQIGSTSSIQNVSIVISEPPPPPVQPKGDISSVSPQSGPVPLTATFVAQINTHESCDGGTYTLDFGDDERSEFTYAANLCASQEVVITHTYDTIGSYTAKLYPVSASSIDSSSPVDTIPVAVQAINHGAFTVTPNIDDNPRKVTVEFGINGSACTSYFLSWGDGTSDISHNAGTAITCTSDSVTKEFTHTYSNNGTFTIRLRRDRGSLSDLTVADEQAASISISSI